MPTGYTSQIAEGISFEQFVLRCARAFGALITMRDEPFDTPIPEKFEVADYHLKQIADARAECNRIRAMSTEEMNAEALKDFEQECQARDKRIKAAYDLRTKYRKMLDEVNLWQPPTPDHQQLKTFMQDQIKSSIDFDCGIDLIKQYEDEQIKRLTGKEWQQKEIQRLETDIDYHRGEHDKECERVAQRNKWVKELRESLKVET